MLGEPVFLAGGACVRTSGEARRLSVLEVWCYASVHTRAGVWLGTACADETGQERQDKWATTSAICRGRRKAGRRAFVHYLLSNVCAMSPPALAHADGWQQPRRQCHGARGGVGGVGGVRELLFTCLGPYVGWSRWTSRTRGDDGGRQWERQHTAQHGTAATAFIPMYVHT